MASFRDPAPPALSPVRGFAGDGAERRREPNGGSHETHDTQLVLLCAASQREDRGIELAPNLNGGAAQKLVRKLVTEGLIEEVAACGSLPVWRRDEENRPLALRITTCGLAAIQVDEGGAPPKAAEPCETEQGTRSC